MEITQIRIDIQRKAMHRHETATLHAYRTDLSGSSLHIGI